MVFINQQFNGLFNNALTPKIPFESSSFFFESNIAALLNKQAHMRLPLWNYFFPSKFNKYSLHSIKRVDINDLTMRMLSSLSLIADSKENLDYLIIGPGSGATAHLATLFNTFFLPTHTTILKLGPQQVDDIIAKLELTEKVGKILLHHNPNIEVVQHYDPVHDRNMNWFYSVIRLKYLELTIIHKRIIKHFLNMDSKGRRVREKTIIYIENKQKWPWFNIDDNIYLQLGGYGGLSFTEYIEMTPQLRRIIKGTCWNIQEEKVVKYDSEWGSSKEFGDSIREYCNEEGLRFFRIKTDHILELSYLTTLLFYEVYKPRINAFLIETFWAHSPTAAKFARLLPFWMPWPDNQTLRMSGEYLRELVKLDVPKAAIIGKYAGVGPDIPNDKLWADYFDNFFKRKLLKGAVGSVDFRGVGALKHLFYDVVSVPNFITKVYNFSRLINDPEFKIIDEDLLRKVMKRVGLRLRKK